MYSQQFQRKPSSLEEHQISRNQKALSGKSLRMPGKLFPMVGPPSFLSVLLRALKQSLTLKRGRCTCGHPLEIPVNFVSQSVFCKWNLLGRWRMYGQLRASPHLSSCLLAFLDMTSAIFCPWPPTTLSHCSATAAAPRAGWLGPHTGGYGADQGPVRDWTCPPLREHGIKWFFINHCD